MRRWSLENITEAENDSVNWRQRRISWQLQGKCENSHERNKQVQIAVHENNAQDNWIKPQIWEREMAEQSREVARLKHRLDVMEGKRLLEGYRRRRTMPGSPETQNPPRRRDRA
ncbi:transport and Golgi organization protein 1 homolog isoform X2 [Felis catus]|uniref:transport and Golgi organization protein 1 homolog isoform X2 n=1 Tax=Felis catus TaxID=9685 RepID=UPI001D1A25AE|nr:transport and Golgi organization protein 1 homolog isoform X2 [Felis catus]